jgi:hypothetical protein
VSTARQPRFSWPLAVPWDRSWFPPIGRKRRVRAAGCIVPTKPTETRGAAGTAAGVGLSIEGVGCPRWIFDQLDAGEAPPGDDDGWLKGLSKRHWAWSGGGADLVTAGSAPHTHIAAALPASRNARTRSFLARCTRCKMCDAKGADVHVRFCAGLEERLAPRGAQAELFAD